MFGDDSRLRGSRAGLAASAALVAVAFATGCADEPSDGVESSSSHEPVRVLERALLTQWARGSSDDGATPRWLKVEGRWRRVLLCEAGCRASFSLPPQAGLRGRSAVLRGAAALVPRGEQASPQTTFRIRVDGVVVFEEKGEGSWSRPFEVDLSRGPAAPTRVTLEVEAASGVSRESLPAAVWLDPWFEWRVPRRKVAPADAPNVLLVTADTTRWDDLSINGGSVRSSALEQLASRGIVFTNVHTVACCTTPSHASLLTSSTARSHGVYHSGGTILGPELPTLAEELGSRGWSTAAFVSAAVLDRRLGLARGFDLYDDPLGDQRRADLTVSLLLDWLDRRGSEDAEPFFVWLHLYDPHQPYEAPPPFTDAYPAGIADDENEQLTALIERTVALAKPPGFLWAHDFPKTAPDALASVGRIGRSRYRGELAYVDAQLSRVLEEFRGRGLDDQTLVVFTSDHGENFLDRGPNLAFDHHGLHAEVTRVPLVVRLPDGRAAGRRHDRMASTLDVAPTILAALDVPAPSTWDGADLLPRATGSPDDRRGPPEYVIVESARGKEIALRTPRWLYREMREAWRDRPSELRRLGYEPGRPQQLYDLSRDPNATIDVYETGHPAMRGIRARLAEFGQRPEGAPAKALVSDEHLRALEALGYVDASDSRDE